MDVMMILVVERTNNKIAQLIKLIHILYYKI